MLEFTPTVINDVFNDPFEKIRYLIGDFNLVVYNIDQQFLGWIKTGEGSSHIAYENSFITEKIDVIKGKQKITLNNTMASDVEKDKFKLLTLGKSTGQMDIYNGVTSNGKLTFSSVMSEMKTDKEEKDSFCIKLIYNKISEVKNELVVGYSKDKGKTWQPYLKTVYRRK